MFIVEYQGEVKLNISVKILKVKESMIFGKN